MKKFLSIITMASLLSTGLVGMGSTAEAAENPSRHGPYYTTFKGSELNSSFPRTLADKCEKAVEDYGTTIKSKSTYTCKWYQMIERRVTSVNGWVVDVTYRPYYKS